MNVLIIHHLESTWESGYKKFNESFESLACKVIQHIKESNYDRVILTQFDSSEPKEEHLNYIFMGDFIDCDYNPENELEDESTDCINNYINDYFEYGYGWEFNHITLKEDDEKNYTVESILDSCDVYQDYYESKWTKGGSHSNIVLIDSWMEELKNDNVSICGHLMGNV